MSRSLVRSSAVLLLGVAAACGSDSSTGPGVTPVTAQITLDASTNYAYLKLGTPAQAVTVSDPGTSSAWDLGFFATNVVVNGGAVGPGGVTAFCVCENAALADIALKDLTAASQLSAFEAIKATQIPAEASFKGDELSPAIGGWFAGAGAAAAAVPARSWLLREGTTAITLGKFRVTSLANASAANAGQITFEYAVQATPGGAFSESQTRTVDVRNGAVVYFDLSTGTTTTAAGNWDLRFTGFEIRANGGVSGSGSMSALVDNGTPYANITAPYAATAPANVFKKDAYAGVFLSQPWYKYNVTGTDNQIWPTFNTYLVKRGTEVFKVQLTSYYGTNGAGRQITVRYAQIK